MMRSGRYLCGLALGAVLALSGCAGFFPSTSSTSTTSTSTSGDYVYVVNQLTNTLSEFSVGSAVLTAISGSPVSLSAVIASSTAASVTVTRQNTFVYVGGQGGIACFSIGTGGALTAVSAGNIVSVGDIVSLDTSPDGQWLIALDSVLDSITVYKINTSTGALTVAAGSPVAYPLAVNGNTSVPQAIRFSPSGALLAIALGPAGDAIFPFTTSSGLLTSGYTLQFPSGNSTLSDNALAFDTTSAYLYIARNGGVSGASVIASYSVASTGAPTAIQTAVTGDAPYAVLVDSANKYLYAANRGTGNVSAFSIASGAFTALSGSPYTSGLTATALVEDNAGKYIIAAARGGSNDYTLYSFDALVGGKLDAVAVGASGADPAGAVAIAATH